MSGNGWSKIAWLAGALLVASQAQAQGFAPPKPMAKGAEIPRGYMPPAGMCRVWINNVPPARQPAPTDCATAIKNRPTNGRVVFGDDDPRERPKDDKKKDGRGRDSEDKGKAKKP
jgi:hypothetical protein